MKTYFEELNENELKNIYGGEKEEIHYNWYNGEDGIHYEWEHL